MAKVKFLLLFTLGLFISLSTMAQYDDEEERRFWAGVILGTNASQITGDRMQGYHHWNINGGAFVSTKLAPMLNATLELSYSKKGARASELEIPYYDIQQNPHLNYKITLPYFEVPVTFNFYDKRKNSIGVGFSYGRLSNPKEMLDGVNLADTYPFKSADWNLLFNSALACYKDKVFINLRYGYSLFSIRSVTNTFLGHRNEQFNKLITLRASYRF